MNTKFIITWIGLLIFGFFSFPIISAVSESSSDYGTLKIDNEFFTIEKDSFSLLEISGTVENQQSGIRIYLTMTKPDNSVHTIKTIPNNYGIFSTTLLLDINWEQGDYTIQGSYRDQQIGTVSFEIVEIYVPEIVSLYIGTIEIEDDEFLKSAGKTVIVKITGTIIDYEKGDEIEFDIIKPDGTTDFLIITGQRTGEYTVRITIQDDWPTGVYQVNANYDSKPLGSVSFSLKELEIPSWVKNNAKWWSEGSINDDDFARGIQFLITEDIMRIPQISQVVEPETKSIPDWIKSNAGWWANGMISDEDFVQGIQFLISQGIIRV